MPTTLKSAACLAAALTAGALYANPASAQDYVEPLSQSHIAAIDDTLKDVIANQGVNTAAIAVIKGGTLAWTGYYGEQAPGVLASARTQFNVASVTKTVSAETILRLVDKGALSLDESMAPYWVDPDIRDDPRHTRLTPRMALTHTTGFPNWRFFREDYKLALEHDPGTTYGYSGEGLQYVAKYAEIKLGKNFEELVLENVFEPLGIKHASFSARAANFKNIAVAITEDGETPKPYCMPGNKYCVGEGEYSAAGNMVISLEEYATFLISVMNGEGYSADLIKDRNRVQVTRPVKYCDEEAPGCPKAQGYGLGWVVVDEAKDKILWHGGSDWSAVTTAYFYQESKDGIIIFLNAPNKFGMDAMPGLIRLLDPTSPIIDQYELWAARE